MGRKPGSTNKVKVVSTPSNSGSGPKTFTINLASVKLPDLTPGKIKANSKDWVEYGDTNKFPQYLAESVSKASEHSAFIALRQNLVAGEGFSVSDNIKGAMEAINLEGQTADELLEHLKVDLSILETFALQVQYNATKDKILNIFYVDSSKIRPSKGLTEGGEPIGYWYSDDWTNVSQNKPKFYPRFNTLEITDEAQIYFYHKRSLGQPYLPEVSYLSALNYIELSYQLGIYSLSSVMNSFNSSCIISIKADMTDEQKAELEKNLRQSFSGAEQAGKIMVNVSENNTDSITITPLTTIDITPMLNAFMLMASNQIVKSHRGNGILIGVDNGGSTLGSDGKLYNTSLEIYQNTVIRNFQLPILNFFKKVLAFNGYKDFELAIGNLSIVSKEQDINILQDYIKPEVWIPEATGYAVEDIRTDMLTPEVAEVEPLPAAA